MMKRRQKARKSLVAALIPAGALLSAAALIYLLSGALLLGGIA